MNWFSRDDADEKVVVPACRQSFLGHGLFSRMSAQQVKRDVFDGSEVGGGMLGSDPAFVVFEDAVHQSMHALDGPVTPDGEAEPVGLLGGGGDVDAGFTLDLGADLALALDHHHRLQPGSVGSRSQPTSWKTVVRRVSIRP